MKNIFIIEHKNKGELNNLDIFNTTYFDFSAAVLDLSIFLNDMKKFYRDENDYNKFIEQFEVVAQSAPREN